MTIKNEKFVGGVVLLLAGAFLYLLELAMAIKESHILTQSETPFDDKLILWVTILTFTGIGIALMALGVQVIKSNKK